MDAVCNRSSRQSLGSKKITTSTLPLNKLKGGLLHNNFTMQLINFGKMNLVINSLAAEMLSDNVRGAHK